MFLGKLVIQITATASELQRQLNAAAAKLQGFSNRMASLGGKAQQLGVSLGLAGGAAAYAAKRMVDDFSNVGDQFAKMAKRTGVSGQALQRFAFAADLSGTSIETVEIGLRQMSRQLVMASSGAESSQRVFSALGVSVEALSNMGGEEQFITLAEAIRNVENPTLRTALAMQLFGRGGTQLIPLLMEGKEGFAAMSEAIKQSGGVMSGTALKDAELLNDELGMFRRTVKFVGLAIGEALSPALSDFLPKLRKWLTEAIAWIKTHKQVVTIIAVAVAVIAILGAAFLALSTIIMAVSAALGILAAAITVLTGGLNLIIAAIVIMLGAGLIDWAIKNTDAMGNLSDAFESGQEALSTLNKSATDAAAAMPDLENLDITETPLQKAAQAVEELTKSLKENAVTFDMGERQAALYKAQVAVWDLPIEEQLQFNQALRKAAISTKQLEIADAFVKVRDAIRDATKELQVQIKTFGMAEGQAQIAKLSMQAQELPAAQQGALQAQIAELQRYTHALARMNAEQQESERAIGKMIARQEEAASVTESVQTPLEKWEEQIATLNKLYEEGRITLETYQRAQLTAQNEALSGLDQSVQQSGTFQTFRTSQVDISALSMGASEPIGPKIDRQTEEQKRQTELLRQIASQGGLPT